ncbi:MAG TPA: hypothetical protein VN688_09500 [Gemmataceae bacterium]|nr:hypothetical protein [Gemmataceae bacterium]
MTTASPSTDIDRSDLIQAVRFAQQCFNRWHTDGILGKEPYHDITTKYSALRGSLEAGEPILTDMRLPSPHICWSCKRPIAAEAKECGECGAPAHTTATHQLRYFIFVGFEIKKLRDGKSLTLSTADACLTEANAHIAALRRKLDSQRIPAVLPAAPASASVRRAPSVAEPRRNVMEILLDPRNIQWLLVSGGVLLVLGLVIWLAAEGIFQNKGVLAVCMGIANFTLLAGGWALISYTRHEMAGRALTLLACLLMPLNLWFYNSQGLITLSQGGHLWIPALVCCVLYAVSARLLRDPMFVYVLVGGVTMTGLLILADRDLQRFWEIAGPCTLLVCLGLVCIHAERIFAEGEGPFSRRRFGLAFFWSGHAVLGAGLLLLLVAQIWGNWLYPLFEPIYRYFESRPPDIVTTESGKLLAFCLVLAGTYAYAYSDLVVRRIGVYIYLAVFALLWTEVLALDLLVAHFGWQLPVMEVLIIAMAVTGLLANLALVNMAEKNSPLLRASSPLGLSLSVLPVLIGVFLHFRATVLPSQYALTGTYVVAMLTAALSCRTSAHLFRHSRPGLSMTYFFGTGAATLAGAAGLLKVAYPEMHWQGQAPLLMLIPLLYLTAARLYQGHTQEKPLLWVAHAATIVMLISSIGAAFKGFLLIEHDALNLSLATFFAEATLFYLLEAFWRKHALSVYACTATACAAVWQLLKYGGVAEEYYILTFAVVGLLLLIAYRFAVLENMNLAGMARAAFHCGNALLSLAFVAGALMVLSELVGGTAGKTVLIRLLFSLIVISLLAVALVRQEGWRRWYVAASVTNAALVVLVLAVLGTLTMPQKLEIVCVVIGLLLLVVGHLGWFREQDRQNDLVSVSLFFGSLLVAMPLAVAVLYCRYAQPNFDTFHTINEVGMLAAGLLLLATGFMCQIKSTTMSGAILLALYLVSLVLFLRVPEKLQTTAVYIMVGGGLFFAVGLVLSLYRDRLLTLPERIKRREGVFRVLTWR